MATFSLNGIPTLTKILTLTFALILILALTLTLKTQGAMGIPEVCTVLEGPVPSKTLATDLDDVTDILYYIIQACITDIQGPNSIHVTFCVNAFMHILYTLIYL